MIQMKQLTATLAAAGLALTMTTAPVLADKDTAKAIAGVVALGLLGAAIAESQARSDHKQYKDHPRLHPDENAVGRCMHRGKRELKKAGGNRLELNKVNSIIAGANGETSVSMRVTGYYPVGKKTSEVICVVKDKRIKSFNYN